MEKHARTKMEILVGALNENVFVKYEDLGVYGGKALTESIEVILGKFSGISMLEVLSQKYYTTETTINLEEVKGSQLLVDVLTKFKGIVRNVIFTRFITITRPEFNNRMMVFEVVDDDMGLITIKLTGCRSYFLYDKFNVGNLVLTYYYNGLNNTVLLEENHENIYCGDNRETMDYFINKIHEVYGVKYLTRTNAFGEYWFDGILVPDTSRKIQMFEYLNEHSNIETGLNEYIEPFKANCSADINFIPKSRFIFNDNEGKVFEEFPELFIACVLNACVYASLSSLFVNFSHNVRVNDRICLIEKQIKQHNGEPNVELDNRNKNNVDFKENVLTTMGLTNNDSDYTFKVNNNIFESWLGYNAQRHAEYGLSIYSGFYCNCGMVYLGNDDEISTKMPMYINVMGVDAENAIEGNSEDLVNIYNSNSMLTLDGGNIARGNRWTYTNIFKPLDVSTMLYKTTVAYETMINGKQTRPLLHGLSELTVVAFETRASQYAVIEKDTLLYKTVIASMQAKDNRQSTLSQVIKDEICSTILKPVHQIMRDVIDYGFMVSENGDLIIEVYNIIPSKLLDYSSYNYVTTSANEEIYDIHSYDYSLKRISMISSIFAKLLLLGKSANMGNELTNFTFKYNTLREFDEYECLSHNVPVDFAFRHQVLKELTTPKNIVRLVNNIERTGNFIDANNLLEICTKLLGATDSFEGSTNVALVINNAKDGFTVKTLVL